MASAACIPSPLAPRSSQQSGSRAASERPQSNRSEPECDVEWSAPLASRTAHFRAEKQAVEHAEAWRKSSENSRGRKYLQLPSTLIFHAMKPTSTPTNAHSYSLTFCKVCLLVSAFFRVVEALKVRAAAVPRLLRATQKTDM